MDENYGIIFIETRNFPSLRQIFEEHIKYVDLEPLVVCSFENHEQFDGYQKILIKNPNNNKAYNQMITQSDFWKKIPFDKVLICERESGILRRGIEEFYEWDYVGAPWKFQQHGGNGGFSWRSVQAMIDISSKFRIGGENEDVFFCNHMKGWKLAPRGVCARFSMETIYQEGTFGLHAIENYFPKEICKKIYNQYKNL